MIATALLLISGFSTGQPVGFTANARGLDEYDTLKQAFDSAEFATMSDYPEVVDLNPTTATMRCVAVCSGNCYGGGGQLTPVRIGRYDEVTPGTPGNGPAFPGKPDRTETKLSTILIPNPVNRDVTNDEIVNYFTTDGRVLVTSALPSGELHTIMTQSQGQSGVTGNVVANYRKKGAELYFSDVGSFTINGAPTSYSAYGYCYTGN